MARRNPVREQLLSDVAHRQRAVGQKVSRIERRNGVALRREGLDPRRDMTAVRQMSTRQLQAYHRRLERFMDRSNNYVAGKGGTPISRQAWNQYQAVQRKINRQADEYTRSLLNIKDKIPTLGQTPGEFMEEKDARRKLKTKGQRRTFDRDERTPTNFTNEGAVKKMTAAQKKRLDPKWLDKRMKNMRKYINTVLKSSGDNDLRKRIGKLNNDQLNLLIDATDFLTNINGKYMMVKASNVDTPRWQSEVVIEFTRGMHDLTEWAETQKLGAASDTRNNPRGIKLYTSTRNDPRGISLYNDTSARSIPVQKRGRDGGGKRQ